MPKKFAALLIAVLVLLVLLLVWLLVKTQSSSTDSSTLSPYSAVYLSTGDMYFGKLSWFPKPRLRDVWFIQQGVDDQNQAALNVVPMDSVFWGPVSEMRLNPEMIVFSVRLEEGSQVVNFLSSKNSGSLPVSGTP